MENETDQQRMSRLDRNSQYRIAALDIAVKRAGQDGGLEGGVDVYALAEGYYAWLQGKIDSDTPENVEIKAER